MERFKIVLLCVVGAIVYGILHDQVTVRICLEYFTVFHPAIFGDTKDPTLLGLGWGVIATWWVGFGLGVPLAVCATVGKLPKVSAVEILRPLGIVLLVLGACAMTTGFVGYWLASSGRYVLSGEVTYWLPPEHVVPFVGVWFTHLASYGFGGLLGIGLWVWVLRRRYRRGKVTVKDVG